MRGRGRDRGEVDRLARLGPSLAAGEREERIDQAFLLGAHGEHAFARWRSDSALASGSASETSMIARSSVSGCGARATLRDEAPLRLERVLEAAE